MSNKSNQNNLISDKFVKRLTVNAVDCPSNHTANAIFHQEGESYIIRPVQSTWDAFFTGLSLNKRTFLERETETADIRDSIV